MTYRSVVGNESGGPPATMRHRGFGPARILAELSGKGVEGHVAERALAYAAGMITRYAAFACRRWPVRALPSSRVLAVRLRDGGS